MTSARRQRLLERRLALVQQSALLRERVVRHVQAVQPWLERAEQVRATWRWMRQHPLVPAALALAALWWRPRWVWRWGWRLWGGWRWWQQSQERWRPWWQTWQTWRQYLKKTVGSDSGIKRASQLPK